MEDKGLVCLIPSLGGGGAERQMTILIGMLNDNGIRPNVVTYYHKSTDYDPSLNIARYNVVAPAKWKRNIQIMSWLIKLRPKVLLSYTWDANIIAAIYKILNPFCRIVVSDRSIFDDKLSRRFKMILSLYRLVDFIVPNSITQAELIKKYRPKLASKIRVITNYTEIERFTVAKRIKKSDEKIRIIIPARINPKKNVLCFLQALAMVQEKHPDVDFECVWYGGGRETPYFKECQKYKEENNIKLIEFRGFSEDISAEIADSDIVCIPSIKEGFPNALAEGLCAGKALLASKVSDNIRICIDGYNGYTFDPKNPEDIANSLLGIIKDKRVRTDFAANSIKLARQLFDRDHFYNSYEEVLFGAK